MEQLELNLYSKKHPRSIFYTACSSLGIPVPVDYITDGVDLSIRVEEKHKAVYKSFVEFLKKPETTKKETIKIKTAFDLYADYDTRIFLDALILNHPVSEVGKVFQVNTEVIKTYQSIFFDLTDFKANPASFLRHVQVGEIADWFILCKTKSVKEIMYAVRSDGNKDLMDMAQGLKEMYDQGYKDWRTFHKLSPQSMLNGVSKADAENYKVAVAGATVAMNAAKIYYQYHDVINKSEKSFAEQWRFILFGDQASNFKAENVITEGIDDIKAALGDQLTKIQPAVEEQKKKSSD